MKIKSSYRKQLANYLNKVNSSSVSNLAAEQVKVVFFLARKDFVENKLTLDDFSDLCNYLWSDGIKDLDKGTDFASVLQGAAELNYYVRKANNVEVSNIVSINLKKALSFE